VAFEEPLAAFPQIQEGVPDFNPMACQKGTAWSVQLSTPDRLTHPLRRVGERGEGRWEEISWDEALDDIAEALVDAVDLEGPESVLFEETVEGGLLTQSAYLRFAGLLGAVTLDANGLINDFPAGQHITFGKFSCASSMDDTFHGELLLIWHSNPSYTWIPYAHFITEARYNGSKVVLIAPDVSPSAGMADQYIPIKPASDSAFALAMCKVIIDEGIFDEPFVKSQTDLPLLVRSDTNRFLRASDVEDGGREDQFFWWDQATDEIGEAPRGLLLLEEEDPALDVRKTIFLADGEEVEVTSVWTLLRERLEDYTPEAASEVTGVHPDVIRGLARDAAVRRTKILEGFNTPKYYHGDLMERAMCLFLGLTGNWGRPGTGIQGLALAGLDGYMLFGMKQGQGLDETNRIIDGLDGALETLRGLDPEASEEMVGNELLARGVAAGTASPPAFFHFYHCGYEETWDKAEWNDADMPRPFSEYVQDSVRRGWWGGIAKPGPSVDPQVLIVVGTNPVRRQRGGTTTLLETLWPKLEKVVVVDNRMSATALQADIVLPAAMQYERTNIQYAITHSFHVGFSEPAVPPAGEARTEWHIFRDLAKKVEEKAEEMGVDEYLDGRRQQRTLEGFGDAFTVQGAYEEEEAVVNEWLQDSIEAGTLPEEATLEGLRERGTARFKGLGMFAPGLSLAADVEPDRTLTAYEWHVNDGVPFPTLTSRAQFYIDHPWFIEADEHLPRHKENPQMGGDYPLFVTSGHSRWTVHAVSMGNEVLAGTHRGEPLGIVSDKDAGPRGISDGDLIEVSNDRGSYSIRCRVSPLVRPGQLIVYNGWEPHMFPGWKGANEVEPGMVKWLHLVGRYGHLRYLPFGWQPVPADRGVFVEVQKA